MKFRITYEVQNPQDTIEEKLSEEESQFQNKLSKDELDELLMECEDVVEKFVKNDRFITIEFDSHGLSAKVIRT